MVGCNYKKISKFDARKLNLSRTHQIMTNMKKSYMFLATGFEETEAIAPIDVMRRAGMEVVLVSITDSLAVEGAHGGCVNADAMFGAVDFNCYITCNITCNIRW